MTPEQDDSRLWEEAERQFRAEAEALRERLRGMEFWYYDEDSRELATKDKWDGEERRISLTDGPYWEGPDRRCRTPKEALEYAIENIRGERWMNRQLLEDLWDHFDDILVLVTGGALCLFHEC